MKKFFWGIIAGAAAVGGVLYGSHETLTSPISIDPNYEAGRQTLMREAAEAYREGEYDDLFPSLILPFVHEYYLNNQSQIASIYISILNSGGNMDAVPDVNNDGEVIWKLYTDSVITYPNLTTDEFMGLIDGKFAIEPNTSLSIRILQSPKSDTTGAEIIPIYELAGIPYPSIEANSEVQTEVQEWIQFKYGTLTTNINVGIMLPTNGIDQDLNFTDSYPMVGVESGSICNQGQIRYLPCDRNLSEQMRKLPAPKLLENSLFLALQSFSGRE